MNRIEIYSSNNTANHWRNYCYDMDTGKDMARYVARERFAFPGGYELYVITDDGGILCHNCCRAEYDLIARSTPGDGWNVTACASTAEAESHVYCDHCYKDIHIQCEDCFEQYDTVAELHNHKCEPFMSKSAS